MNKCKNCKNSENKYVLVIPNDSANPVQIDLWNYKEGAAQLIGSISSKNRKEKKIVDHLIFCGNCHSSIQKHFIKEANELSSIEELI
tara:strand:+ start:59 stop:319 length:261 start_codon:yes stop_codon:yes gene_type:complete